MDYNYESFDAEEACRAIREELAWEKRQMMKEDCKEREYENVKS